MYLYQTLPLCSTRVNQTHSCTQLTVVLAQTHSCTCSNSPLHSLKSFSPFAISFLRTWHFFIIKLIVIGSELMHEYRGFPTTDNSTLTYRNEIYINHFVSMLVTHYPLPWHLGTWNTVVPWLRLRHPDQLSSAVSCRLALD